MLDAQYALNVDDVHLLDNLKETDVYRDYVTTIMSSPIHTLMMSRYVNNVDISGDVESSKLSVDNVNKLFKAAVSRVIVNIISDTTILNELANMKIDDVKKDLIDDFKIKYLLGHADDAHYEKVKSTIKDKPDVNSVLYKGFIAWYKRKHDVDEINLNDVAEELSKTKKVKPKAVKKIVQPESNGTIDLSADHIRL